MRPSGRQADALRTVRFTRNYTKHAEGSVLVEFGDTKVLCTASVDAGVPRFLKGKGEGWITAEYSMLPRATHTRNDREASKGKQGGRTLEIQRLIGRSLRAMVDLKKLGENIRSLSPAKEESRHKKRKAYSAPEAPVTPMIKRRLIPYKNKSFVQDNHAFSVSPATFRAAACVRV